MATMLGAVRTYLGKTQVEAARAAGCDPAVLSRLENGLRLSDRLAKKLAKLYGVRREAVERWATEEAPDDLADAIGKARQEVERERHQSA